MVVLNIFLVSMRNLFQLALFQPPVVDNDWRYIAPTAMGLCSDKGGALRINHFNSGPWGQKTSRDLHPLQLFGGPLCWLCRSWRLVLRTIVSSSPSRMPTSNAMASRRRTGSRLSFFRRSLAKQKTSAKMGFICTPLDNSAIIWSHYDLTNLVMSYFPSQDSTWIGISVAVSGLYVGWWSFMIPLVPNSWWLLRNLVIETKKIENLRSTGSFQKFQYKMCKKNFLAILK